MHKGVRYIGGPDTLGMSDMQSFERPRRVRYTGGGAGGGVRFLEGGIQRYKDTQGGVRYANGVTYKGG